MTYEFSSSEDTIIHGVGLRGLLMGILLIFIALVDFVRMYQKEVDIDLSTGLTIFQNVMLILIALAFVLPFNNFRNIAKTQGKDIPELMSGLSKMTYSFIIIATVMAISILSEIVRLIWG